ncbi:aminotransferase class V-fold PLP-dependent enzyme [Acidaminobacter hydrogenoformans]|uniref:cysteine desulfurase n=1 Tax=Acidaminobacter hydrogenoformans DSM 2784 TaxID=1120920 RepID=A0A1G5RSK4_9FIRM|nr:aminotransferase class V-fold PLP-dependent enzyme [Acidaminobacter hydrogenoformans]SCZ76279.1 cysteine desulfurase family protein [Acidaminobacter hydrogenoformans DSM 2784]
MYYFDNGATSFPKAPGVAAAVADYIEHVGVNVGRGFYSEALGAAGVMLDCREKLQRLFNAPEGFETIFTMNITESINVILKGYLKAGDHVIVSSLEHNAVMRPLVSLERRGVTFTRAPFDAEGALEVEALSGLIQPNTKLIMVTHASNVCGTLNDLNRIGELAEAHGIPLVVDAAQTAGVMPIDLQKNKAKAICFTGHKSLLGPQGIGGFVIDKAFAAMVEPLIEGGTGSRSDSEAQPAMLPDKFESGTQNLPGIYGLNTALDYVNDVGIEAIHAKELQLTEQFMNGVRDMEGVRLVGRHGTENRTAVVSIDFELHDNADIAYLLDSEYDIKTRVGMHCAPSAHKALGTFPQGTVRFSFSYFNTEEEIDYLLESLRKILA